MKLIICLLAFFAFGILILYSFTNRVWDELADEDWDGDASFIRENLFQRDADAF